MSLKNNQLVIPTVSYPKTIRDSNGRCWTLQGVASDPTNKKSNVAMWDGVIWDIIGSA